MMALASSGSAEPNAGWGSQKGRPASSAPFPGTASNRAARASCNRISTSSLSVADWDALHLALRLGTLGQGDRQHAVLERGAYLVRIDIRTNLERALELAMPALAVEGAVVFHLLLALERQHTVVQRHFDVVLLQAGQLGHDLRLLIGLAHLDM